MTRRCNCGFAVGSQYIRSLWPQNGHLHRWASCYLWSCASGRCSYYCDVDRWSIHRRVCNWTYVYHHPSILRMRYISSMPGSSLTIYQSEVAPPCIRGMLASMQQWMIGLGIMVAVSSDSSLITSIHALTPLPAMGGLCLFSTQRRLFLEVSTCSPNSACPHLNLRHLVSPRVTALAHRDRQRAGRSLRADPPPLKQRCNKQPARRARTEPDPRKCRL